MRAQVALNTGGTIWAMGQVPQWRAILLLTWPRPVVLEQWCLQIYLYLRLLLMT